MEHRKEKPVLTSAFLTSIRLESVEKMGFFDLGSVNGGASAWCGPRFDPLRPDVPSSGGNGATRQKAPDTIRSSTGRLRKGGGDGVAFDRITVDTDKMGGVPSIRGLRVPVATVVGMVADGMGEEEILKAYPDLEREDVREALRYAAEAVREREIPLV